MEEIKSQEKSDKNWYDKSYKWLLIIPALMLIFSAIYLFYFYQNNGDIIHKDVSLTGGTAITVFDSNIDAGALSNKLKASLPDIQYRIISDFRSGQQKAVSFETIAEPEKIISLLESELGYKLTSENSSVEFSGASLSEGFYRQLISAIIAAFLLMSWVVFIIFSDTWKIKAFSTLFTFFAVTLTMQGVGWVRTISTLIIFAVAIAFLFIKNMKKIEKITGIILAIAFIILIFYNPSQIFNQILLIITGLSLVGLYIYTSIPSFAIILCAFADIIMTLVVINLLGVYISGAGIIAFLMLIGYSVDTDILLTTRMFRDKEGALNKRLFEAFKTGMTMTLTAIASVGISLILVYSFSDSLTQVFGIILLGLSFDIFNTWLTNASLLKWFMEARRLK